MPIYGFTVNQTVALSEGNIQFSNWQGAERSPETI